jgi:Domain of unknown function (DUF4191)
MAKKGGAPAQAAGKQAAGRAAKNAAGQAAGEPGRFRQIGIAIGFVRKSNPKALPIVAASGLGVIAVFVLVGLLTGTAGLLIPPGVLFGLLTAMIIFGRLARSAQFAAIEGQPGAAAAIVQNMRRGNFTVTPAIAGNRNMDIVHRVVGKPGVILLGEGSPTGLASLLSNEKRKLGRIAYGVPVHELQVGDEAGQIPISKLERKLLTMPRALKPAAVHDLNNRLKALGTSVPNPKGPIPRTGRMPRPPRPRTR